MTENARIDSWGELPDFATEAEEQEWWETHSITDRLLAEAGARERARRGRAASGDRPADRLARARAKTG